MDKINTTIINQSWGCGDIIFCQSIANHLVKQGYNVLWPVLDIYSPLAKHFPNVTMVDKALVNIDYSRTDTYEINGCRVIPLRFTDSLCKVPYTDCMKSKYWFFDMQWQQWKDDCFIQRDLKAEHSLFTLLGLNAGDKYNLISKQFTTGGGRSVVIPEPANGLKNVYMKFIEGYTLIDWLLIMQQATEIWAVASSNVFLMELFPMQAKSIHLFIRRPQEQNHDNYSYILTKKYILHD